MITILFLLLPSFSAVQPSDVDQILYRFEQKRRKAKTKQQYFRAVDDARAALKDFIDKTAKGPERARATYYHAEMFLHRMEYARAIEKFDAFVLRHPSHRKVATARLAAAELCLRLERDQDAKRRFEDWKKSYPKDPRVFQVRMYLAILKVFERDFTSAARDFEALRNEYKGKRQEWTATMQLAVCHQLAEDRDKAQSVLEDVIRRCPEQSMVAMAKGHLKQYARLGKLLPSGKETDKLGKKFHLGGHRGKVVILYFYSARIPLAETEVTFLKDTFKHFQGKDLVILGVCIDKRRKSFEDFTVAKSLPWEVFFDGNGLDGYLARLYHVEGIACLRVIDRKGRARFYNISGRDLRLSVQKLLEEP